MIVLDTHALVWWFSGSSRLSNKAMQAIESGLRGDGVVASSISAWEIAMLVAKGRLEFSIDISRWLELAGQTEGFRFIPIDNLLAVQSVTLPGEFHADPADRMIVALARQLGAPLITADDKIARYAHVKSIW